MSDSRAVTLLLAAVLASGCAVAPTSVSVSGIVSRLTPHESAGTRYLLHLPAAYESREDWPLILFLHGAGERGRNLELVKREGLPRILETLPDFPFVVVSPQEQRDRRWTAEGLASLLDDVAAKYRVDRGRVYATGLSSGAVAALELAIRYPERIAGVAAITANRIPTSPCAIEDVPVWIFHNAGDEHVPAARAKRLARALEDCGGEVKLTIYPREGHDAWSETYRTQALYDWFLGRPRRDR